MAAKERLKQLRTNVDCLTLSATPIPRTLQMGLAGIRDMSVIETPPKDRLAIQTSIVKFSTETIAAAIRQELARDGQVYVVHNRVESIDSLAALVQRLVPEARVAVAHGQMPESRAGEGDAGLRGGPGGRAGGHHHHRERPGHPARQHPHREPRRPLRAGPALPAPRPCRPLRPAGLRLPARPPGDARSARSRASGWLRSRSSPTWARASASPPWTWSCAGPGTCWAASRAGTSRRWASTST